MKPEEERIEFTSLEEKIQSMAKGDTKSLGLETLSGIACLSGSEKAVILCPGVSGSCYGLFPLAEMLANNGISVVSLDPPSHRKSKLNVFRYGLYAEELAKTALFLRNIGHEQIAVVSHSAGAIAILYHLHGIHSEEEKEAIARNNPFFQYGNNASKNISSNLKDVCFDKVVLAGLPMNIRQIAPGFLYTAPFIRAMYYLFHKANKTNSENITDYKKPEKAVLEWQHYAIKEQLAVARAYFTSLCISPDELPGISKKEIKQKLLALAGIYDNVSFGLSALFGITEKSLQEYIQYLNRTINNPHLSEPSLEYLKKAIKEAKQGIAIIDAKSLDNSSPIYNLALFPTSHFSGNKERKLCSLYAITGKPAEEVLRVIKNF